ncbi:ABC transporter permease [Streptomyces cyaneochromogenes]|uniref:ABC transporter permease n=1 Tax=Streptomyces cyaneochromogenes TaxID=2496836 RepID=A0A3Q9ETN7_9ACTN|nr:ABC transporter permease [Streptomyces cyaneochromogenes]AZQ35735.1 ABC transporter permease [Streptomyces cyaneochromogenes]
MTTVVTIETSTAVAPSRGPRGLVWVMLRVHRWALWFWVLLVAVGAGALLFVHGPGTDAAWSEYRAMGCDSPEVGQACDYSGPAISRLGLANSLGGLLNFVPLLAAAWAGGALIGRELENGTAQLAWAQSVSPARWLAAKLAVPAALLVAGTTLLTLLHRLAWSSAAPLRSIVPWREWYDDDIFLANGTLATAHALLGLAVGALAGLLLRRALPALAAAAVGLLVLTQALGSLRPYLWPVETLTQKGMYPPYTGMVLDDGALTSTGARVEDPLCINDTKCLADHDIVGFYRDYHPSSHFWPLQLVETGIVLAVVALAVLAAFRLLRRRTGAAV